MTSPFLQVHCRSDDIVCFEFCRRPPSFNGFSTPQPQKSRMSATPEEDLEPAVSRRSSSQRQLFTAAAATAASPDAAAPPGSRRNTEPSGENPRPASYGTSPEQDASRQESSRQQPSGLVRRLSQVVGGGGESRGGEFKGEESRGGSQFRASESGGQTAPRSRQPRPSEPAGASAGFEDARSPQRSGAVGGGGGGVSGGSFRQALPPQGTATAAFAERVGTAPPPPEAPQGDPPGAPYETGLQAQPTFEMGSWFGERGPPQADPNYPGSSPPPQQSWSSPAGPENIFSPTPPGAGYGHGRAPSAPPTLEELAAASVEGFEGGVRQIGFQLGFPEDPASLQGSPQDPGMESRLRSEQRYGGTLQRPAVQPGVQPGGFSFGYPPAGVSQNRGMSQLEDHGGEQLYGLQPQAPGVAGQEGGKAGRRSDGAGLPQSAVQSIHDSINGVLLELR